MQYNLFIYVYVTIIWVKIPWNFDLTDTFYFKKTKIFCHPKRSKTKSKNLIKQEKSHKFIIFHAFRQRYEMFRLRSCFLRSTQQRIEVIDKEKYPPNPNLFHAKRQMFSTSALLCLFYFSVISSAVSLLSSEFTSST